MHNAADIGPDAVDGTVGAEATGVDLQVGGALVNDLAKDVDLHLQETETPAHQ